jgi:diaminohydroxyphosphoribosylaminopyrimidine deaminase/5-amino-6-(5-phosphoribosylamino)uracil reductase
MVDATDRDHDHDHDRNRNRDERMIDRALLLAERGRGRTTPNPIVGAVVVSSEGVIVGQGAHLTAGEPHAEVHALAAAGESARGGTLYCTLEPCCHVGRTGACVERIVEAGIVRVVAAMRDPNPRVSGGGFAYLRSHGVDVIEGVRAGRAADVNAPFITWITAHRPFVTVKLAVSRGGFAGARDRRVTLTGAVTNRYMHRQRAEIDAIAVGADTVLIDDPLLTARGCYRYRPLTRVIVDWRVRVSPSARVFSTLAAGPVIMVVTGEAARTSRGHLETLALRGVECVVFETRDLSAITSRLASRNVLSLLVEGGPRLQMAFFEAGLVDRVQRIVTPQALGGGVAVWDAARYGCGPATPVRSTPLGGDILMECDVHGTH